MNTRMQLRGARRVSRLAVTLLAAGLAWTLPAAAQVDTTPEHGTGRSAKESVVATAFMVAAANPLAAQAGYDVLKAGGTAADAMVAVQLMLNLVEPQSSGIGGGGFLLLYRAADRSVVTVDGREEAPARVAPQLFLQPDGTPEPFWPQRITGGKAVGVPGLLVFLWMWGAIFVWNGIWLYRASGFFPFEAGLLWGINGALAGSLASGLFLGQFFDSEVQTNILMWMGMALHLGITLRRRLGEGVLVAG